jgi:hypothetical protein
MLGLAAACSLVWSGAARADGPSKEQCVNAYQGAQVDLKASALGSAREKIAICLASSCPHVLQTDCADWLKTIDARQPSVVLSFQGKDGSPVNGVTATVDGKPFTGKTDGRAVDVDPGEHVFSFSPPGEPKVDVRVIVREGEKSQKVDAVSKLYVAPKALTTTPPPAAPAPRTERPVPWQVYALGGVGLAGVGSFAGFGISGTRGKADLDKCKPACAEDDVSSVRTRFIVADVSLAVSLVAVAAATIFFVTRPEVPVSADKGTAKVKPSTRTADVTWLGTGVRVEL